VITCFSTVGSEAVYFHKPLVILDHLRQDIQNYHRNGVALQALNAEELKDLIDEILKGKININQNAYEEFINNYAYKIDGNVGRRCVEFIKNIKRPQTTVHSPQ
jgi:chromosome condensin MukBEF complex kleisin-like MukF subunit